MSSLAPAKRGLSKSQHISLGIPRHVALPLVLVLGIIVTFITILSTEPFLTAASLIVLFLLARILWRPGEPPIAVAFLFIQWLQVAAPIFDASFKGISLTDLEGSPGVVTATWLSFAGFIALALGFRLALRGQGPAPWQTLIAEVRQYDVFKVFIIYCLGQFTVLGLGRLLLSQGSGLFQAVLAVGNLCWIFFFLLAVTALVQRRGYTLLFLAFVFEFGRGFLSFFSDYKLVFLILALAYATARPQLNAKRIAIVFALFLFFGTLACAWSVIKGEYRLYLNQGTGNQVVATGAPVTEQISRIADLMINKGLPNLDQGFQILLQRVEYTYFFGRIVERVPLVVPYENGKFWGAALLHVMMPRLFFPDKAWVADYENTEYYTGLLIILPGSASTEVPMGYMAESYIDFGPLGMMAPIFLLGLLYGLIYRYAISRKRFLLFAYGAVPIILLPALSYELTSLKILGGCVSTFLVFLVVYHLVVPIAHRAVLASGRATPENLFANRVQSPKSSG